ncbi:MAG: SH3 domain-containing protein [Bdellovibrionota bacterium]
MRFFRILTFATVLGLFFGVVSISIAATTKLEKTTVRKKPSSTSAALGTLPAGSNVEILGETGGFTEVKFKGATGFVATSDLNAGAKDVTKSLGTGEAKKTGYGKKDIAAAINMGAPVEAASGLMAQASSARKTVSKADEMADEFDSLPEDVTSSAEESVDEAGETAAALGSSAVSSAKSQAAKKKAQLEAKQPDATAAVNAKQDEMKSSLENASAAKALSAGKKSVADKRAEVESQIGGQVDDLNSQKDALEGEMANTSVSKMAAGATANAGRAKGSVTAIGDMSNVEALESLQFSKSEFTSASPFVSEGHLKSKTLK